MKFKDESLSGSYDEKHGILYIYYSNRDCYCYGSEDPDNYVTFRSISDDRLIGYLIYGFKDRAYKGELDFSKFDPVFKTRIAELTKELQNDSIAEVSNS